MEENIQAYVVPLCTKNVYSEYSLGDTVFSVKIPVKVDVKTGCFATSLNHAIYRTEIEVNGTENKFHIKTIFDTELIIGGSDNNVINSIINTNVRSIIFKSVKILFYKYIFGLGISAKIPLPPIFDEE